MIPHLWCPTMNIISTALHCNVLHWTELHCTALYSIALHCTWITNSMDKRHFWDADSQPAGQEIPRLLWNPKFYYHVYNSPLLESTLSMMNSVHNLSHVFLRSILNIILTSTPMSPRDLFPSSRSNKLKFICTFHFKTMQRHGNK
jgi:hypothetical protein